MPAAPPIAVGSGIGSPTAKLVDQNTGATLFSVNPFGDSFTGGVRVAFAAKPFLIEVTDEGKGFEGTNPGGYGLVGMRERAAGIGGRLEVVTTPGRGTTVFLFGPETAGLS